MTQCHVALMAQKSSYHFCYVVVVYTNLDTDKRIVAYRTRKLLRSQHALKLFAIYSIFQSAKLFFAIRAVLCSKILVTLVALFGFLNNARLTVRPAPRRALAVHSHIMTAFAMRFWLGTGLRHPYFLPPLPALRPFMLPKAVGVL